MPLISCECVLHRFRQRPPNWTLPIKEIFKFTLALKQWRVCTICSAITLLHLRIHSSKNYSLIFLHVSTLISSIISPTNILQMLNQFIQLTLQFLHFIPMIQPISLKFFYIFLILYATPRFLPQGQVQNGTKRPPTENDRRPAPALGRLFDLPEAPNRSKFFQLRPELLGSPRTHEAQELSSLEGSLAMIAHQRSPQLFKNNFSSRRQHPLLPLVPIHCLQEGRESFRDRGNDPRKTHLPANTTKKLRPLLQARHPTRREDLKLRAPPNASSSELYPTGSTGKAGLGDAGRDEGTGIPDYPVYHQEFQFLSPQ